ncbi:MAG: class D sortase [Ruminococcus sp.]|nr:class D sortase [Ruminococcus sp.]
MKKSIILHIVTPFIVCLVCLGVLITAMIKPYDKLKVYLNLAFMDNLKITPDGSTQGLVIRENEIKEEVPEENVSDTGEVIRPQFAELYAIIKSDAFELDVPVYFGSNPELFERGACQSTGSVLVGEEGNTVISAHEDTFFSELSNLKIGDIITVNTNYGRFVYTVKELIEFNKNNNKYVNPSDETKLTLYTCKKDILGSPDGRTGVICEPTEKNFYTGEVQE